MNKLNKAVITGTIAIIGLVSSGIVNSQNGLDPYYDGEGKPKTLLNSIQRTEMGLVSRNYAIHPEGYWPLGVAGASPEIPYIGVRFYSVPVTFNKFFSSIPKIATSISGLDAKNYSTRIKVSAKDITKRGFNITFETWADSVIYGVEAQWIAVGY